MPITNAKTVKKHAFVSGIVATINGKPYTRLLSKEEAELLKNAPIRTAKERADMDERMDKMFKETNPELYKRTYGEKN